MQYLLMIPGPVEISEDILEVAHGRPMAHYGADWAETYRATEAAFSRLIDSDGRTFFMPGSGSLGLETISATFCRGRRCLVVTNGSFGDRLLSITEPHAAQATALRLPLDRPVSLEAIQRELSSTAYDVLSVVHTETSTGILNPVQHIAEIAKEAGVLFFVDAVASAGVEELKMNEWGIDAVVTASQKGMECPPGIALVNIDARLLVHLDDVEPASWYTNLKVWKDFYDAWYDWHPFPVTLPPNIILALQKSMDKMFDEGTDTRHRRYRDVTERLREALSVLGLEPFAKPGDQAHGLTSVATAGAFDPAELVSYMRSERGIRISGSFGELKDSVFRFGHMSTAQCSETNLFRLVDSIAAFLEGKHLIGAGAREAAGAMVLERG